MKVESWKISLVRDWKKRKRCGKRIQRWM